MGRRDSVPTPRTSRTIARVKRLGRIHWGTFVFLIVFVILLVVVARYALVPGLDAIRQNPTTQHSDALTAGYGLLLLFVLLFILFVGIVMTFRFGRLFFPRPTEPRTKTQYTDAWAESGKRMQVPPEEQSEEE